MKKIIILLICLYGFGVLRAQIPEMPKSVLSPNAASLGLYGEIPVSHFTGTPNISIPLYEVNDGDISFPISLSYHASGVRPDQRPGWVGLGWSLNAGGMISRVVKDMPDEYSNYANFIWKYRHASNAGFLYNHSVLDTDRWNQRDYIREIAQDTTHYKDTEPDEFTFSFSGYQGKFYLDHKGNWKIQSERPIKLVSQSSLLDIPQILHKGSYYDFQEEIKNAPSLAGFTIITEDGTQYVFGGVSLAIEYSKDFFDQHEDEWFATSWYLTKVIYTNSIEITLNYERGDYINQMFISMNHDMGSYSANEKETFCNTHNFTTLNQSYQGKLVAPIYLRNIHFPTGCIEFDREETTELDYSQKIYDDHANNKGKNSSTFMSIVRNAGKSWLTYPTLLSNLKWYKLKSMRINSNFSSFSKQYNFEYNDNPSQRLMLLSVIEYSENKKGAKYAFSYKDADRLPDYLSNRVDHWGYFNDTEALMIIEPPFYYFHDTYHSRREVNENVLHYGILEKIVYPTEGYTRYEFEPHDYRRQLKINRWEGCVPEREAPYNSFAGGLRIKKIYNSTTGNSADEYLSKEYSYQIDSLLNFSLYGTSSGVLGGQFQYYFKNYYVYSYSHSDVRFHRKLFSSQSMLPGCENSSGSHIGYTEVIEKIPSKGYTRYTFSNFDNGYLDLPAEAIVQESQTAHDAYASRSHLRGLLLLQEDYNGEKHLIRKRELKYSNSLDSFVRSMKAKRDIACPNMTGLNKDVFPEYHIWYDEGTSYKIYTDTPRILQEKETLYEKNSPISITQTNYIYNNNGLPKKITVTDSEGTHTTDYKYVTEGNDYVHREMVNRHMLSFPTEQTLTFTDYAGASYKVETQQFSYKKELNNYVLASISKAKGDYPLEKELDFFSYSNKSKPIFIKGRSTKTSYLWGYHGLYQIAKIEGVDYSEVRKALSSLGLDPYKTSFSKEDIALIRNIRDFLPNAQVTTYEYIPLVGVTSITDPRGLTTYYEYDSFGRLKQTYIREYGKKAVLKNYEYHYANQ